MRALTVEVHDVCPPVVDEVRALLAALRLVGVERPTLLAVPLFVDERGKSWDLRDHPATVRLLQRQQARGAEIVQHGLTHRSPGPPPPGLRNWLMHHWFSRGCAEFAHLDARQARERLVLGRRILGDCGLWADGFVAPAWQQSREAYGQLAQLGFGFTAFLNRVVTLAPHHREVATPALTFAAGHPMVERAKRTVMRGLESYARATPLLRIALHPEDVRTPGLLEHVIDRIRALTRERRLVTYARWSPRPAVAA